MPLVSVKVKLHCTDLLCCKAAKKALEKQVCLRCSLRQVFVVFITSWKVNVAYIHIYIYRPRLKLCPCHQPISTSRPTIQLTMKQSCSVVQSITYCNLFMLVNRTGYIIYLIVAICSFYEWKNKIKQEPELLTWSLRNIKKITFHIFIGKCRYKVDCHWSMYL